MQLQKIISLRRVHPDHFFLGVQVKIKENHAKHQGSFDPFEPHKPLEKQRKTAGNTQNAKEIPWLEKTKENQNTKEKKIRARNFRNYSYMI